MWSEPESLLALEIRATLLGPDDFGSHGQHNCCVIHKQGVGYENRFSAILWRLLSWYNQRQIVLRARHIPGWLNIIADKLSRHKQVTQTVVPAAGGVRPLMCKVAHTSGGSVCNQVQPQASQVCVPSAGSKSLEGGCSQHPLGGARCLCFSPVSAEQGGHHDPGERLPKADSHCPGMAQHALVLRPGKSVSADSTRPTPCRESVDTAVQPVSTQGSPRSQP